MVPNSATHHIVNLGDGRSKLNWQKMFKCRGSFSYMFFKVAVLKNFANFTGKHLCCSFFLMKLQVFRHRCFPVKF